MAMIMTVTKTATMIMRTMIGLTMRMMEMVMIGWWWKCLESAAEMCGLAHRPLRHLVDDVVQHHNVLSINQMTKIIIQRSEFSIMSWFYEENDKHDEQKSHTTNWCIVVFLSLYSHTVKFYCTGFLPNSPSVPHLDILGGLNNVK